MRDFETIYEYSFNGSNIWHIIPIFIFVTLGFGMVYYVKRYHKRFSFMRQYILFFSWGLGLIASVMLIGLLINIPKILKSEKELKNMINNDTFLRVEGLTENYKLDSINGNFIEYFSVSGIDFNYTDNFIINGFHQTSKRHGPIYKNGLRVRIGYRVVDGENQILKLEMKRETN